MSSKQGFQTPVSALSAGANTNVNANLNGFMGLKFTKTQISIGVVVFLGVVGIGIYL